MKTESPRTLPGKVPDCERNSTTCMSTEITHNLRSGIVERLSAISSPFFYFLVPPSQESSSPARDRKSTRLNSSHSQISYAVFCLKKKKKLKLQPRGQIKSSCGRHEISASAQQLSPQISAFDECVTLLPDKASSLRKHIVQQTRRM